MTTYNDVPHGGKSFHGTSTSQGAVDGKYIVDGAEEKQTSWSVNNVPNVTVPTPGEPEFTGDITINTTNPSAKTGGKGPARGSPGRRAARMVL